MQGLSEASLGLLRRVAWGVQKAPETLENVAFELPDRSGRAADHLGADPGAENHPSARMMAARIGMIWARTS